MTLMRRVARWALGTGVFLSAVFAASVLIGQDSGRAGAAHTEILTSISGTQANWKNSMVLIQGSIPGGPSPCAEGEADPTTGCIYVWAKNVDNPTGASAFQVEFDYDSNLVHVGSMASSSAWLASTNRSVSCQQATITETAGVGNAVVACNSLNDPPPYGPNCPSHCTGLLATISFESTDNVGQTVLNFSAETALVDTPPDPDDVAPIPATVRSMTVTVAKCADFAGQAGPDGTIRINDILYVVGKYFTPDGDLNNSPPASPNTLVDDILISVNQYFADCWQ